MNAGIQESAPAAKLADAPTLDLAALKAAADEANNGNWARRMSNFDRLANPITILALLDRLERAEKGIDRAVNSMRLARESDLLAAQLSHKAKVGAREALQAAEEALARCYNVADWPADGSTTQDAALALVRAALA